MDVRLKNRSRSRGWLGVLAIAFLIYLQWGTIFPRYETPSRTADIDLPSDLDRIIFQRFDDLVSKKELIYAPSTPEHLEDDGFHLEIRTVPSLKEKPTPRPSDPGRFKSSSFAAPPPSQIIIDVGSTHRLLLDKFPVYRPSLLLSPTTFARQTSDLDFSDIIAAWAVLKALPTHHVAIYNCGIESSSSPGQKHVQIVPEPEHSEFVLWPSTATIYTNTDVTTSVSHVPFKHFVLQIPQTASEKHVFQQYERLLALARKALNDAGRPKDEYNVALTVHWIAIVPRSKASADGPAADMLAMLGMISLKDEAERGRWEQAGWAKHLQELGIPL